MCNIYIYIYKICGFYIIKWFIGIAVFFHTVLRWVVLWSLVCQQDCLLEILLMQDIHGNFMLIFSVCCNFPPLTILLLISAQDTSKFFYPVIFLFYLLTYLGLAYLSMFLLWWPASAQPSWSLADVVSPVALSGTWPLTFHHLLVL